MLLMAQRRERSLETNRIPLETQMFQGNTAKMLRTFHPAVAEEVELRSGNQRVAGSIPNPTCSKTSLPLVWCILSSVEEVQLEVEKKAR